MALRNCRCSTELCIPHLYRPSTAVLSLAIQKRDFRAICLEHPQLPLQALAILGRPLRIQAGLIESVIFG